MPRPDAHPTGLPLASEQDGSYPRPQLVRAGWAELDGTWEFRLDGADAGSAAGWSAGLPEPGEILVPFPPESPASGIAATGFHRVVWYQRTITADDLDRAGRNAANPRMLLHFGAVDYRARVWLDGRLVGEHEGGHTPFSFDITELLGGTGEHLLVVRAEDDPHDVTQPRGKQDWHADPHVIWYRRTTGIWQPVWLEAVPEISITALAWVPLDQATVSLTVRFRGRAGAGSRVRVALRWVEGAEGLGAAEITMPQSADQVELVVPVARQRNAQAAEELAWTPERPRLVDAEVSVLAPDGALVDQVASYLGLRVVGVDRGAFLLNDLPYQLRSVLEQGYWPESHLAAPSPQALRREVELIKELGFNGVRVHQKVEDPRFLYWADRLGLAVWAEAPAAYAFNATAVQRLLREWLDAVERDISHPSIVTWVPVNESWGVPQISGDPTQRAFARALADATRALDSSRPVISNDGWEHVDSDIITVHDYESDAERLGARYADPAARAELFAGRGPAGRPILVDGVGDRGQPLMLTEFGGVRYQPGAEDDGGWGYSEACDAADFVARIAGLYNGIRSSGILAGSCYTQLTDTAQEVNGLLGADRTPKVPIEQLRAAITGEG